METENPRRLSGVHQNAAFIASMGWKSRNSAPLSVEGQVFSLTFPFIESVGIAWGLHHFTLARQLESSDWICSVRR